MSELLNELTVLPYLEARGIIHSGAKVEVLTGGVSNVVLGVSDGPRELVLKQALPELKVEGTWRADQRRAIVEANCMKLLHSITPSNVPELVDVDPEAFTLVLSRAPRSATVWKSDLLEGRVDLLVADQLGEILARWHNYSAANPQVLRDYAEDTLFDQLRIDPFYRAIARVHNQLQPRMDQLIHELESKKTHLVHGDFSPKNILVDNHHAIVLDFEVAHTGNPVFDHAFLIAHLLCKSFYQRAISHDFANAAERFLSSYSASADIDDFLGWHVAAIALARVDGVSKVHYLDSTAQSLLRERAISLLLQPTAPSL
jgi:5-methylthioribose kinase